MIISLFHLYKYVHRIKKATNNKKLPKINREKITITLKIFLVIFNVFYITKTCSSCTARYFSCVAV